MSYGEGGQDMPQAESDRNLLLRLLVQDSVARELDNQLAPVRTQVQIFIGRVGNLERDYGALRAVVDDLRAVINGDPALGIKGLLSTVDEIKAALSKQTDELRNQGIYIRVGFAILIALGFMDNQRIAQFFAILFKGLGF